MTDKNKNWQYYLNAFRGHAYKKPFNYYEYPIFIICEELKLSEPSNVSAALRLLIKNNITFYDIFKYVNSSGIISFAEVKKDYRKFYDSLISDIEKIDKMNKTNHFNL